MNQDDIILQIQSLVTITVTEDQEADWEQSAPGSGYYIIDLSDKSVYKLDFGSSRFSKTSDGNDIKVDPDVDGMWTAAPLIPGMQEEEKELTKTLPPTYIDPNL